jgi:phosphatidylglycerophosphate synthase
MLDILLDKIKKLFQEFKRSELCKNCQYWRKRAQTKIDYIAQELYRNGIGANAITVFGFVVGLMSINFLAMNLYFEALTCIVINRFCDALDGSVARILGQTPFGTFLDSCLDFIFYAGVIFGFALANPENNAVAACFWLFSFTASSVALLSYGVLSYGQKPKQAASFWESPFYLEGMTQGIEMVIAFLLLCMMPFAFLPVAIAVGCWCLIKALVVVSSAYYRLVILNKKSR